MEYLNNEQSDTLDFEIGKFLYENRNKINQMTVEEIAGLGNFSQSSISRFFSKNGFDGYKDFKLINEKDAMLDEKISHDYKDNDIGFDNIIDNIEKNIIDSLNILKELNKDIVIQLVNDILKSHRIVFAGYSMCINAFKSTQNVLLYENLNVYAPNDYKSQKNFIGQLNNKDIIVFSTLSSEWYKNGFDNFIDFYLPKTKAKKYMITTQHVHNYKNWFDEMIVLEKEDEKDVYAGGYFRLYMFDMLLSSYILSQLQRQ